MPKDWTTLTGEKFEKYVELSEKIKRYESQKLHERAESNKNYRDKYGRMPEQEPHTYKNDSEYVELLNERNALLDDNSSFRLSLRLK